MDQTKLTELEAAAVAAKTAAEAAGGSDEALNKAHKDAEAALATFKTSSDPVAKALEDEKKRTQRTEAEKAEYTLRKQAERAKALGIDPAKVLGLSAGDDITVSNDNDDDDKPMTRGEFKRIQQEAASKTALEMADAIQDEAERNLTKEYLKRVVPSGNPAEDLKFARLAVNSVKTGKILEEVSRGGRPATHSSGTSGPAAGGSDAEFVPTATEAALMKPPFRLSQADILKARQQSQK